MKDFTLLAVVAAAFLFPTPLRSAEVGRLAGTFRGHAVVVDKRSSPSKFRYTLDPLKIKVAPDATIAAAATLEVAVSFDGGPYRRVDRRQVAATGEVMKIKVTTTRITGTATLTFANGIQLAGPFDVSAKTGHGTVKFAKKNKDFDITGAASKKK